MEIVYGLVGLVTGPPGSEIHRPLPPFPTPPHPLARRGVFFPRFPTPAPAQVLAPAHGPETPPSNIRDKKRWQERGSRNKYFPQIRVIAGPVTENPPRPAP